MSGNPFTPSFGAMPLIFAGRSRLLSTVVSGLNGKVGNPYRSCLFVGARGTGKTSLLTKISEMAMQEAWIAVDVTDDANMLEEIFQQVKARATHLLPAEAKMRLKGISFSGFGLQWDNAESNKTTWRIAMSDILDLLAQSDIGLLITVDEAKANSDELRALVIAYQHFVREGRNVALMLAGLPHHISAIIKDDSISFLRRATREHLGPIQEDYEVRNSIRGTIEKTGRSINDTALEMATTATQGFPYLIQLVGFYIWEQSPESPTITAQDVERGISSARERMIANIFESTLREISDTDKAFLMAMLPDDGPSKMADIEARMQETRSYVSQYRLRLIDQGIIGERGRGYVGFEIPMMKDYLRSLYEDFNK